MFIIIRATLVSFVVFLVANKWGDLPHPDTRALQGAWEIVSVERSGVPDSTVTGFWLTFADRQAHFQLPLDMPAPTLTVPAAPVIDEKMYLR